MADSKKGSKAKQKMVQVLKQAKESLRILETLERETIAKARSFVRIPSAAEREKLRNERILASLKKLGVATQSELDALQAKFQQLETSLTSSKKSTEKSGSSSKTKASKKGSTQSSSGHVNS